MTLDENEKEALSIVANALQSVMLLAGQLRLSLGQLNATTAAEIEAAAVRAVRAVKRLQRGDKS